MTVAIRTAADVRGAEVEQVSAADMMRVPRTDRTKRAGLSPGLAASGGMSTDMGRSCAGRTGQSSGKPGPDAGASGQLSGPMAERIAAFLMTRHPIKTVENVAADTGIGAEAIRKWLTRASAPSFGAMVSLIAAYGPEFLAAVVRDGRGRTPGWITDEARRRRRAEIQRQLDTLQHEIAAIDAEDGVLFNGGADGCGAH